MDLNSQQQEVVEHVHGPLLVLAPMGTGKTLVIARRAARAVQEGLDPDSLLCLSFTNRAAREMRERIATVLGPRGSEVTVRTFHGLCAELLRHEFQPLGVPPDFTICDEEDARALLAETCNGQGILSKPPTRRPASCSASSKRSNWLRVSPAIAWPSARCSRLFVRNPT